MTCARRIAAVVAAGVAVAASPGERALAGGTSTFWSYSRLMARIDHARVAAGGATYRIHADLVVCNGLGRASIRGHVRRWRAFACTQSVFRHGTLEDVSFRVRPLGRRRFAIVNPHLGP